MTKKMAEDLTDYLLERGIKVEYLHSDVDTLRRVELLRELREGKIDVIVGINLLREGLDLPEVSLVAILDADKEGFLRSYRSLIQTIGRAARNVSGTVIMYADEMTDSMSKAIEETNRRREIQMAYNEEHHIDPKPLIKKISDVNDMLAKEDVDTQELLEGGYRNSGKAGNSHLDCRTRRPRKPTGAMRRFSRPAFPRRISQTLFASFPIRCIPRPNSCNSNWRRACVTRFATSRRSCGPSHRHSSRQPISDGLR